MATDTHETDEVTAGAEGAGDDGVFDPAAMLRDMYAEEVRGKAPVAAAAEEPEAAAEESAEGEDDIEEEQEEGEDDIEEAEGEEEPVAELDFKDPKAAAKAYAGMRDRLREQSETMAELKEVLGVKSRKDIPGALKAKLEEAAAENVPVTLPTPHRPLADVPNERVLEEAAAHYTALMKWCAKNPDGGECPLIKEKDGSPKEVDAEWVASRMEISERVLFPHKGKDGSSQPSLLEQRRTQLRAISEDAKAAAAAFPSLWQEAPANAPDHVKQAHAQQRGVLDSMVRDIAAEVPEVMQYSKALSFLSDATVGRLIRQGYAAAVKDGRVLLNRLTSEKPPVAKAPAKKGAPPVRAGSTTPPPARKAGDPLDEQIAAAMARGDIQAANRLEMRRIMAAAGRPVGPA